MRTLRLKRRLYPAFRTGQARMTCVAVISMLLMVMCGNLYADVELPALSTSEPVTFHGEIAKGLKIEMRLYRDGPSLYGTYLYEVFGRDIQVKGTINERGEIALQESVKGKVTGNFKGKFVSKDRVEGKWYRSGSDNGRSFYLASAGAPSAATRPIPTTKPGVGDHEASPAAKVAPPAPKAEATVKPLAAVEARPQQPASVKQESVSVSGEAPRRLQQGKMEAVVLPTVSAEEPPQAPAKIEVQTAKKPPIEGKVVDPVKEKSPLPWRTLFFNLKLAGAVGGILLLGGGLAWLAIVAGGIAGLRDNSALFRKAHTLGLSFLPGVFLLALGVGAVLSVFVE
jgi:hypothetical protein